MYWAVTEFEACAGIIVFATALTVNERSLAGVAPPIYVPAIDTVSPTAYPLPPLVMSRLSTTPNTSIVYWNDEVPVPYGGANDSVADPACVGF